MSNKLKKGIILIVFIILNLMVAFKILSLKSDWAVAGFILYIISLIFITYKTTTKL